MNLDVTYNELHLNKLTGRRYSFGTKATLSCKDSAALLIGPEEIYCSDDGSWDDISDRQCGKFRTYSFDFKLTLTFGDSLKLQHVENRFWKD